MVCVEHVVKRITGRISHSRPKTMNKLEAKNQRRERLLAASACYAAPLDPAHPGSNMFGCFPCQVCKSIYRWPTQQGTVKCDDCGLVQELEKTEQHNAQGEPRRENPAVPKANER